MITKTCIFALTGLIAMAEAIPSDILSPIAKLGPTAVMGVILLWLVTKTMPVKDALFSQTVKDVANQQHDDSVILNATLTEIRSACAVMQAALIKKQEN